MAATPQEIKKYMNKGAETVEEGLPGWFGTFADMMTLLFAFFVLLAAISTIDPVKLQNMADSMGKSVGTKQKLDNQAMSLGDIHKAATKMIEEMAADPETGEKPVEVTTSPKGVTIGISSDISFESGSATTKPGFLEMLRQITLQHEIPLIFDEVVTSFRFAFGGAQEFYGITPDICSLGKAVAGGFPLTAVGGREDIMSHFDASAVQAEEWMPQIGTLSGNPIAAVAGLATVKILKKPGTYESCLLYTSPSPRD